MKFAIGLVLAAVAVTATTTSSATALPKTSCSKGRSGAESCDFACPDVEDPVYDENGVEYSNECYMRQEKCQGDSNKRGETPVVSTVDAQRKLASDPGHKGEACGDMFCPEDYTPVCGSDGVTYSNECNLGITSCNHPEQNITMASDGECTSTLAPSATPSPSKSSGGAESCDFACPDVEDPVYDENGIEYSNECYMRQAKCEGDGGDNIENPDVSTVGA